MLGGDLMRPARMLLRAAPGPRSAATSGHSCRQGQPRGPPARPVSMARCNAAHHLPSRARAAASAAPHTSRAAALGPAAAAAAACRRCFSSHRRRA